MVTLSNSSKASLNSALRSSSRLEPMLHLVDKHREQFWKMGNHLTLSNSSYLASTWCLYKLSTINLVWGPLKCTKSNFNPVHVFLHFKSFCLVVLQLILASKLSNLIIRKQISSEQPQRVRMRHEKKTMLFLSFRNGACG